ncbi:hypothetical protein HHI36_007839 [Cryptolaemus montrouzieri]|uniref:Uncharacterized protein n=1 Tax=Cryptolaemus montrouzieri TaxID=559131 RepID=A0ABD2MR21_9CUCU
MEVNRLLGDEITYKVSIRKLSINSNVETKRIRLSDVLRLERIGDSEPPQNVSIDAVYELSCSRKLSDLEKAITNFNPENKINELKRIFTRLYHLKLSLERIHDDNVDIVTQTEVLIGWHEHLYIQSKKVFQDSVIREEEVSGLHISSLVASVPSLPEVVHTSSTRLPSRDVGADRVQNLITIMEEYNERQGGGSAQN